MNETDVKLDDILTCECYSLEQAEHIMSLMSKKFKLEMVYEVQKVRYWVMPKHWPWTLNDKVREYPQLKFKRTFEAKFDDSASGRIYGGLYYDEEWKNELVLSFNRQQYQYENKELIEKIKKWFFELNPKRRKIKMEIKDESVS